jgi:hypothetical protein
MNITQPQQQLKRAGSRNVPTERKPRDPIPIFYQPNVPLGQRH